MKKFYYLILCFTLLLFFNCSHEKHGPMPWEKETAGEAEVIQSAAEQPRPLVKVESRFPHDEFFILSRQDVLKRNPCSECHNKPLSTLIAKTSKGQKTHQDITLKHGNSEMEKCSDCHSKDGLSLISGGKEISINHGYQICYPCHQGQFKDWLGGAHGKQSLTWAGDRVRLSCGECHNPHSPGFPQVQPAYEPRFNY